MTDSRTTFYFVRHAHSPYVPDREATRGLSAHGRRDASRVAEILTQRGVDVVVSSPYARAVETVREIAETIGVEIIIDKGFRERTVAERHVDDFEEALARLWEDPTFSWEGGESNEVAQERGVEAVERTLQRWQGKDVVIGTHGNILTLILNRYDETHNFEFWKQLTMPDIYRVTFAVNKSVRIKRIYSNE